MNSRNPLSRREREVGELVAQGLTNREIAERLFISERTIEGHVQSIRNKLGFTSRTQIATWVVEQKGDLGRAGASAPAAAGPLQIAPRNPLPVPLTSFIGRERDLQELSSLLAATRLLTLTGAGGCGKTRLAVQLAGECLERYQGGVVFVDLAPLSEPELVSRAVVAALGIKEQPGQMHLQTLLAYLGRRHFLILLDNCEHLVDACAQLAERLLSACPGLTVLATSRERLRVSGEAAWPVSPLALPPADWPKRLEPAAGYDAVRLFIDRATLTAGGFHASTANIGVAVEICRQLDGIPLAIELAAARVSSMAPEQMLKRLEDRFRFLTAGSRTAAARQQTLEAAVRWSYELLSEEQRRLFRRLSVFVGGFQPEAAEAVCAGGGLDPAGIGRLVSELVDMSLVVFEQQPDGTGRYRLLETLRQYGWERLLESGEAELLRSRHLNHFLALAEATQPRYIRAWERLRVLDPELDNMRGALDWSSTTGGDAELRLAVPFGALCLGRGYLIEGGERLDAALQRVQSESVARADAHHYAGAIALRQGNYPEAARQFEQALRHRQQAEREWNTRDYLGSALMIQGRLSEARLQLGKAFEFAEEQDMAPPRAAARHSLADLAYEEGNFAEARAAAATSLSMSQRLNMPGVTALNLKLLGEICLREDNDTNAARAHFSDAMQLIRRTPDPFTLAAILDDFAWLATAEFQPVRALRLAGAASALRERAGALPRPDHHKRVAGGIEMARRQLAAAEQETAWQEGRSMSKEEVIAYALAEDT